jgi:hypothetical protein
VLAALTALAAAAPIASAVAPPATPGAQGLPLLDVRNDAAMGAPATKAAAISPSSSAARADLRRALGRQGLVQADRRTGTIRFLAKLDGTLTGPSSAPSRSVALGYVRSHLGALGLTSGDLPSLDAAGATVSKTGLRVVRWTQSSRGIPAFDNSLRVALAKDGAVLAVLGSPAHGLSAAGVTPAISPTEAVAAVLRNVHSTLVPSRVAGGPAGATLETVFENGERASLVLFVEGAATRLAWSTFVKVSSTATYHAVVDAAGGRVLYRSNTVKFAAGDASIYLNHPGATSGGTPTTTNLVTDGFIAASQPHLQNGTWAQAWSDLNDNDAVDPGESITPTTGDFSYSQTQTGNTAPACAPIAPCSWTPGADFTAATDWTANRRQNGVQAFWFASNFHDHLAGAAIGFTGPGNFEASGGDAVQVQTDDGAATSPSGGPDAGHVDNANMTTLPNPHPPVMQMYLWYHDQVLSPFRNVNGADDGSIVYHEYTHGLSNRLVTKDGTPSTVGALNSPQAGAMGEGWSDWYAKDYLAAQGLQADTPADGEVDMGEFADASPDKLRFQPMDCPAGSASPSCPGSPGAGAGGFTYGDFGRILNRPEVHADGEIWGETLWDIRTQLGSATTERLVTDAMRLSPPEPSMLDQRNAILLADGAAGARANAPALWDAFRTRGMGFYASTTGGFDTSPVEDFSPPPAPPAQAVPAEPVSDTSALVDPGEDTTPADETLPPDSPTSKLGKAGKGRIAITITCASACTAKGGLKVGKALRRKLHVKSATLGTGTLVLKAAGTKTLTIKVTRKAAKAARRRRVRSLKPMLSVSVQDDAGNAATLKKAIKLKL